MPVHTSNGKNVSLTSFCPVRYSSKMPMTPTRLVSLTIPTKSLPPAGHGDADRLRQDDRHERPRPADAERQRGLALAGRHRRSDRCGRPRP